MGQRIRRNMGQTMGHHSQPEDEESQRPTPRIPMRSAPPRRLSAGVVVVRNTASGWVFLLLRAYRNWDFPKGCVEPGEDPLDAARREVHEEASISNLRFTWGNVFRETPPYSHNKVARYYVAETSTETVTLTVNPQLGRPEHDEWRWVTLDQALSLCSPRLDPIVRWAAEMIGAMAPAVNEHEPV